MEPLEWILIGSAIASVISSIVGGVFNYKSAKSSQDSAYQLAQNQLDAQVEANNLNRQFYEQNIERNSVRNQMKEYIAAGVNPNLANTNFVSMPAFQTQATSGQPIYNNSMVQSAKGLIANQIKSSMYDMLIKKEQYLQMKQNRQFTDKKIEFQTFLNMLKSDEHWDKVLHSSLAQEYVTSLVNEDGSWNDEFYDLLNSYRHDFNNRLIESGYRNSNLITQNDVLSSRAALTEEQANKVREEIKRLQQLVKRGEFSDSDFMRVLEVIKTIFSIF